MTFSAELKSKLDQHYKAFNHSQISPDPLQFLHMFKNAADIELIGFISATFAYGSVRQIVNTLSKITAILGDHPHELLITSDESSLRNKFEGISHRFYTVNDVSSFFIILNKVLNRYGSLKDLFIKGYNHEKPDLKDAIKTFHDNIFRIAEENRIKTTPGITFMFADPYKGSACKRTNLFLRWMVRKDELDFGLWDKIPPSKLVIPVDTHIARICKEIGLTKRKNVSWKMASEITNNLMVMDPDDPVKYDFAICHIGIRKLIF